MGDHLAIIARLAAQYPSANIQKPTIAAYMSALSEIPDDLLAAACERAVTVCKWFPTIAEILKCVRKNEEARIGVPCPSEAWDFVLRYIDTGCGPDRASLGEFAMANRAVGMIGGWHHLGMGQVTDRPWRRKEFIMAYKSLLRDSRADMLMGPAARQIVYGEGSPSYFERTGRMEKIGDGDGILKQLAARAKEQAQ